MAAAEVSHPEFDFEAVFDVDDYLYFYEEILSEERTDAQVQALVEIIHLDAPLDILDLACGFGRHANRLAALGHRVVGVDFMPGFLEIARQNAERRGVQVDYRLGDMRKIEFDQTFDRVLLLFTSFGYFDDDENRQVLYNAARALRSGGLLIFDSSNRDAVMKGFWPFHVLEKDGNLMIDRNVFDTVTGRLYNRRIVIRNGERRDKPFFVRLYNPSEIRSLFADVGLEPVKFCSDWEGTLLSADSRRIIAVGRK